MKNIIIIILILSQSLAEDLSLKDVLKSIENYHPLIKATNEKKIQAEAELLANIGAFDRTLKIDSNNYPNSYYERARVDSTLEQPLLFNGSKLFAGYRQSSGTLPSYEDEFQTSSSGKFRAGFEIPLLRDGSVDRRRTNISKSEYEKQIADASIAYRKNELFKLGTISYWNWVLKNKKVKVYEELVKTAEARQQQLSVRSTTGDVPKFDVDDNNRLLLQRQSQLVTAKQELTITIQDLSLFYRDSNSNPIVITGTANNTNKKYESTSELLNSKLTDIINIQPELKKISNEIEQFELEKNLSNNQLLPKLDAQFVAEQENSKIDQTQEPTEFKVGIKIEIPLQRRTAQGKKEQAESKIRELKNNFEFIKNQINTDLEISKNNVKVSQEKYELAKKEAEIARQLQNGEQIRFDHGDSNLIFINIREQTAAEAATKLIDAELDIVKSIAELRALSLNWD